MPVETRWLADFAGILVVEPEATIAALPGGAAPVTVSAADVALRDFGEKRLRAATCVSEPLDRAPFLAPDMVELENHGIILAAINARVGTQELQKRASVVVSLVARARGHHAAPVLISRIVLAVNHAIARTAILSNTVAPSATRSELGKLFPNQTARTELKSLICLHLPRATDRD